MKHLAGGNSFDLVFVVIVDFVERHDHAREHVQQVTSDAFVVACAENQGGRLAGIIVKAGDA